MAALGGAVFAALAQVFVRKLVHTEPTAAIVFYFSVTAATLLRCSPCRSAGCVPTPREAVLLVERGAPGRDRADPADRELPPRGDGRDRAVRVCLDAAGARSSATSLFGELPTRAMLIGAALIVAAGLFIIWRERRLGIQRAAARKVCAAG